MKIELRNVEYAAFASQETHCFSATIYVDGKKAGTVSNQGRGGPDNIEPYALQQRIDAYAKTLPLIDCTEFGGTGTMPSSAEIIIGDLLNAYLEERDLKRLCTKKTLFRIPTEEYAEGEYRTVKAKFSPAVKTYLVNKYGGDVVILNERFR